MTWIKIAGRPGDKYAVYEHPYSGWRVCHCGHATALWPYYLTDPAEPTRFIVSHNNRGFQNLEAAKAAVIYILCGRAVITDGCVNLNALGEEVNQR